VEIPSLQQLIVSPLDTNKVAVIVLNQTASKEWLIQYAQDKNLTFPIIANADSIHSAYHIGAIPYGNPMPSYFIINSKGIIDRRVDGQFGMIPQLKARILELISQESYEE
jgi:hypothetical protein